MNHSTLPLAFALILGSALVGPSTRADEASTAPDWFGRVTEGAASAPDQAFQVVVKGRRSYSEDRALGDAHLRVDDAIDRWLAPDVPTDWQPPRTLVDSLIAERHLQPIPVESEAMGLDPSLPAPDVLYVAGYRMDLSPDHRGDFLAAYQREIGDQRMTLAGGVLAFVLSILSIFVGYIRAEEATRGYYTTRLRVVAGAAAGVAAVVAYRLLS